MMPRATQIPPFPMFEHSDEEREAVQADLDRRDQENHAMKGESLSLAQCESCKKAVPIPEAKSK
jgi:hypothetical protein